MQTKQLDIKLLTQCIHHHGGWSADLLNEINIMTWIHQTPSDLISTTQIQSFLMAMMAGQLHAESNIQFLQDWGMLEKFWTLAWRCSMIWESQHYEAPGQIVRNHWQGLQWSGCVAQWVGSLQLHTTGDRLIAGFGLHLPHKRCEHITQLWAAVRSCCFVFCMSHFLASSSAIAPWSILSAPKSIIFLPQNANCIIETSCAFCC